MHAVTHSTVRLACCRWFVTGRRAVEEALWAEKERQEHAVTERQQEAEDRQELEGAIGAHSRGEEMEVGALDGQVADALVGAAAGEAAPMTVE